MTRIDIAADHAANKVEWQAGKSAAALLLESRIGEQFDAIVADACKKGTWYGFSLKAARTGI